MPSIAGVPYLKGIPFRSRSIFSALRTFPQVCSAASIRSKAIPRQVGRESSCSYGSCDDAPSRMSIQSDSRSGALDFGALYRVRPAPA